MSNFKPYRRISIIELRPVDHADIYEFEKTGTIQPHLNVKVSISQADIDNGSPKIGDMIARNPKDTSDQWLVAEQYFKHNYEQY